MRLSRIELCDLRSPEAIAKGVLDQFPTIPAPVPVDDIALALGILEIKRTTFDGFEGMLLTDRVWSAGAILANTAYGPQRTRFTIAHELGHYLMEWHILSDTAGFRCRLSDMRESREDRKAQRQEAQANRFAIELLAPKSLVDPLLGREPDLHDAARLRGTLDISLEAALRCMIDRRDEQLAAVFSKDGVVRYHIKGADFLWLNLKSGDSLPRSSAACQAIRNGTLGIYETVETTPIVWTNGTNAELWEQTRVGANRTAVTLLEASLRDEQDEDSGLDELSTPGFR